MLDLWDIFVPLLKQRPETVCQHLSSMADTMDNTFSSLAHDLDETKTTSGPYLDPTQNAAQMLNKLKTMCRQVYAVSARLTELSRTSKSLRGEMREGLRVPALCLHCSFLTLLSLSSL